tara:strand:+ start:414 stop:683 length:270 start_codon:yes stop_codon:yes gene_type:complete
MKKNPLRFENLHLPIVAIAKDDWNRYEVFLFDLVSTFLCKYKFYLNPLQTRPYLSFSPDGNGILFFFFKEKIKWTAGKRFADKAQAYRY